MAQVPHYLCRRLILRHRRPRHIRARRRVPLRAEGVPSRRCHASHGPSHLSDAVHGDRKPFFHAALRDDWQATRVPHVIGSAGLVRFMVRLLDVLEQSYCWSQLLQHRRWSK